MPEEGAGTSCADPCGFEAWSGWPEAWTALPDSCSALATTIAESSRDWFSGHGSGSGIATVGSGPKKARARLAGTVAEFRDSVFGPGAGAPDLLTGSDEALGSRLWRGLASPDPSVSPSCAKQTSAKLTVCPVEYSQLRPLEGLEQSMVPGITGWTVVVTCSTS